MKSLTITVILTLLFACSPNGEQAIAVSGKWYTYAESGDYMELWLGEDKAMSYLSSIDQFLLYDLDRVADTLKFSLIESKVVDSHEFALKVLQKHKNLFQATFISDTKIDTLKTYFLVSEDIPVI